jgi:hypothetical protein
VVPIRKAVMVKPGIRSYLRDGFHRTHGINDLLLRTLFARPRGWDSEVYLQEERT